jgi:hypothetical protein
LPGYDSMKRSFLCVWYVIPTPPSFSSSTEGLVGEGVVLES